MVQLRTASLGGGALLLIAGSLALAMNRQTDPPARPPAEASAQSIPPTPSPPTSKQEFLGVVLARMTADIAPRFTGRLRDVRVRLGDRVTAGSPLAELDLPSVRYELRMAEATFQAATVDKDRASVELAETEERLKRRQALSAESIISSEDLSAARYQQKLAASRAKALEAQMAERRAQVERLRKDQSDLLIVAPFDGVIAARYADPGSNVTPSTPILRLISADDLFVRFAVPEGKTTGLQIGAPVIVRAGEQGTARRAIIDKVAPEVDAASRMIFVEARLEMAEAAGHALAGELARVSLD
jgi:RND family efflux transporter MFP subunit